MSPTKRTSWASLGVLALGASCLPHAAAYRVDIKDTDEVREVCSGMFGGKNAYIDVKFNPSSTGQVALVIYEWADVAYLGAETPDETVGSGRTSDLPKTYICTTSAVRSGLCSKSDLGAFITTLPQGKTMNDTSIFTSGIRFDSSAFPSLGSEPFYDDDLNDGESSPLTSVYKDYDDFPTSTTRTHSAIPTSVAKQVEDMDPGTGIAGDDAELETQLEEEILEEMEEAEAEMEAELAAEEEALDSMGVRSVKRGLPMLRIGFAGGNVPAKRGLSSGSLRAKRQISDDLVDDLGRLGSDDTITPEEELEEILQELKEAQEEEEAEGDAFEKEYEEVITKTSSSVVSRPTTAPKRPSAALGSGGSVDGISAGGGNAVPVYNGAIKYAVPKTGYYCVGVVPVTLVNSRKRSLPLARHSAEHAEYSGSVLFKNVFEGELPAAEYPKIGFYGFLSFVYAVLAAGWGFLCFQNRRELLPMQYYISGTIVFLVMEMLANFAYYRYVNKNGGGSGSMAFLFVVATLNAARNSLSFFLLLIVSMGLSVVTPSLGNIMNRVRLLTALHFVFGVLYAVGTVRVEIESASLFLVLFMIFPLALTLTAFLMWTIISLNGTITHLAARKQRHKLQMFKRLYRILMMSVIAVAAFFVISSLSLSNRLEEDYAPRNWKYRWVLLDASLALIYLAAFSAVAWLWRPSRDNVRFAMSQELAQDEDDADDYEFGSLENRPVHHDNDYDEMDDEERGFISNGHADEAQGFKSENVVFALEDEDSDDEHTHHRAGQFKDEEEAQAEAEGDVGRTREREKGKLD